jgi:chloride channel 3/4/5
MTSDIVTLPASGFELRDVEKLLAENNYQGYPIVEDMDSKILLGYIGRTELRYAAQRAKNDQMAPQRAKCYFTPSAGRPAVTPSAAYPAITFDTIAATATQMSVDFSRFVDSTPLSVHPRLPLETVMELFKKMGPRAILVEYRGRLTGLVTVKDCLKYQFKVEAQDNPRDESIIAEQHEKIWHIFRRLGSWVALKANNLSGGRIRLRDGLVSGGIQISPIERHESQNGDEGDVELEDRHTNGIAQRTLL